MGMRLSGGSSSVIVTQTNPTFLMTDTGPEIDRNRWGHSSTFCIYKLTNLVNNKMYVGKAIDLYNRFVTYQRKVVEYIDEGEKQQGIVQAIAEFGWTDFELEVLEEGINREAIREREQHYIDELGTMAPDGYNETRAKSKNPRGLKHDEFLGLYFTLENWRATVKERRALIYQIKQKSENYWPIVIEKLHHYRETGYEKGLKEVFSRQKVLYAKKVCELSLMVDGGQTST